MHPEYFHTLKLSFSDSHTKHGLTAFSEYAALFAVNELPVWYYWYYYTVTACMLIPIIKELVVNLVQVPDVQTSADGQHGAPHHQTHSVQSA